MFKSKKQEDINKEDVVKDAAQETGSQENVSKEEAASEQDAAEENKGEAEGEEPAQEQPQPTAEEQLTAKLAEANDKYIRLAAEFDNYRRRVAKEKLDLISTAGEDVIKGLLPVLDDCERALQVLNSSTDTEAAKAAKEGTELIYNKLMGYLKSKGLAPIEAVGKELDTDFHEAVAQFPVQVTGEFPCGGGFAAAVETGEHDDRGFAGEGQFRCTAAQQCDQLIVDDLDHLLPGGDAADDFAALALFFDFFDKFVCDLQIDIRLQKGDPDLLHGICDIRFGQRTLPAQTFEDCVELVTQ